MPSFKSTLLTAAGLLALSCLASPLVAGAETTALTATAKASDAAATAADPATARRLALASQLVDLDGTRAATEHMTEQLAPLIKMALNGQAEIRALPQVDQDKINELVTAEFDSYFAPELLKSFIGYYAKNFSEAELQSLVTTFQTPDVKKYAGVRVKSSTDMESIGANLGQEAAVRAMKKYVEWKKTQPK